MLEQLPSGGQDLFEIMPCNFAGMPGGCKFHNNRFAPQCMCIWQVPTCEFVLMEPGEQPPAHTRPEGEETAPTHDGQKWSFNCGICGLCEPLRQAQWAADLENATQRYLDGLDMEDGDDPMYH